MIRKSEISLLKANLLSFLLLAVVAGVLIPLYIWIWGVGFSEIVHSGILSVFKPTYYILEYLSTNVGIMFAGIIGSAITILYSILLFSLGLLVPHELIHGLTAMVVGKAQWKDLKFGMIWKKCAAYCHCNKALTVAQYRWVTLMPLILLGIIPSISSLILGDSFMLLYGMIGITVAIGDIWIAWMLRNEDGSTKVYDHPSTAGYFLFDTDEEFEEIKKSI